MSILPIRRRLTKIDVRQLPVMLINVLTTDLVCAIPTAKAALKLGQYRNRKIVPIIATSCEL
jgi:hypothetical protein